MSKINWEATALKNGWTKVEIDPSEDRTNNDPCFYHEDQDRVWPLDDPEGAVRDLGYDENDPSWLADTEFYNEVDIDISDDPDVYGTPNSGW